MGKKRKLRMSVAGRFAERRIDEKADSGKGPQGQKRRAKKEPLRTGSKSLAYFFLSVLRDRRTSSTVSLLPVLLFHLDYAPTVQDLLFFLPTPQRSRSRETSLSGDQEGQHSAFAFLRLPEPFTQHQPSAISPGEAKMVGTRQPSETRQFNLQKSCEEQKPSD